MALQEVDPLVCSIPGIEGPHINPSSTSIDYAGLSLSCPDVEGESLFRSFTQRSPYSRHDKSRT